MARTLLLAFLLCQVCGVVRGYHHQMQHISTLQTLGNKALMNHSHSHSVKVGNYVARFKDPPAIQSESAWTALAAPFGTTVKQKDTSTKAESVKAGGRGVSLATLELIKTWVDGATGHVPSTPGSGSIARTNFKACEGATADAFVICQGPYDKEPNDKCKSKDKCTAHPFAKYYEVDMNIINSQLVIPLTKEENVSFAEWVGFGTPDTFISHNWGGSFVHFVETAQAFYEKKKGAKSKAEYFFWVCTFANNQHSVNLGTSVATSPFAVALDAATQMLILQDDGIAGDASKVWSFTLTRAWCVFEMHYAIKIKRRIYIGCASGAFLTSKTGETQQISIADMDYMDTGKKCGCAFTPLLYGFDAADKATNPSEFGIADLQKVNDWMAANPLDDCKTPNNTPDKCLTSRIKPTTQPACTDYADAPARVQNINDLIALYNKPGTTNGYVPARFGRTERPDGG